MTTRSTFEHDLPVILEDLYLGRTPDYRDEALAAVRRTRQRPPWTFAGRWISMADIASRPAVVPRVPWRAVGLALLVIALLLVAALAAGSRQVRVPPPFGPAANGRFAYAVGGDIFTIDPATGSSVAVVTGPDHDTMPMFSPDGTRILFHRNADDTSQAFDLVVVDADGTNPVVLNPETLRGDPGAEWAYDSRSVIAELQAGNGLRVFDATRTAEAHILSTVASAYGRPYRPPEGRELLLVGFTSDGWQLSLLDLASGTERVVVPPLAGASFGGASWSPSGTQLVFSRSPADGSDSRRLFLVNADGTDLRQITHAPGTWYDMDPIWSPDGSKIAFTRWEQTGPDTWDIRPTGIYDVASGTVSPAGPLPRDVRAQAPTADDGDASAGEGFFLDWSPDGRRLIAQHSEAPGHPVLIDPDHGRWKVLDVLAGAEAPSMAWQRLALQP